MGFFDITESFLKKREKIKRENTQKKKKFNKKYSRTIKLLNTIKASGKKSLLNLKKSRKKLNWNNDFKW